MATWLYRIGEAAARRAWAVTLTPAVLSLAGTKVMPKKLGLPLMPRRKLWNVARRMRNAPRSRTAGCGRAYPGGYERGAGSAGAD